MRDRNPAKARRAAHRKQLEEELRTLRADINAATARFVSLVAEHANSGHHVDHRLDNPQSFLTWQLGLTPHAARETILLAQALSDLPLLREAFEAGTLGFEQIRLVASIAHPDSEEELVRLAKGMSGGQLARFVTLYRKAFVSRKDALKSRRLRTSYHSDGTYSIHGSVPADEGMLIERAIEAALKEMKESQGRDLDEEAEDPWAAQKADALVLVAERALASAGPLEGKPVKHQIVIHADLAALLDPDADRAVAHVEDGGPISEEALDRIACGASLVPLIERAGEPLSVGRASRGMTTAIERALKARDEICRFPGCARTIYTEGHHLRHWVQGGETKLDNLVRLCWTHHRLVHDEHLTATKVGDGFRFTRSDGSVIEPPQAPPPRASWTSSDRLTETAIDPETCYPDWGGEPGDLSYVADIELTQYASLGLPDRSMGARAAPDP